MKAQIEVDDRLWDRALAIVGTDSLADEVVTVALETLVAEYEIEQDLRRPIEEIHLPEERVE